MSLLAGQIQGQNKGIIPLPSPAQQIWQDAELVALICYDLHVFDGKKYKQAENRICQHFGLILFHIIKYILRISVAPFSRKCEKLQRFFPILRNFFTAK